MRSLNPVIWAAAVLVLASCAGTAATGDSDQTTPVPATEAVSEPAPDIATASTLFSERMDTIDQAVADWRNSASIEAAHLAAETAANLVVGPNGPGYGDRDGDGVISGETTAGILPGLDGTPTGLATPLAAVGCVERDVLGGTWTNPGSEWGAMLTAIDNWRPDSNTMPTLASHPMRIVGWATFTLRSDSVNEAHEYGGHAKLHVDVSHRSLDC
ncbi:MAG: hypothetical protein OEX97_13490 [Acidimicrobiia bacterium]|nr:hypothetical protein [Acidimicrobiia bacterium]